MTIKMNDNLVVAHPTNEQMRQRHRLISTQVALIIIQPQYAAKLIIMIT